MQPVSFYKLELEDRSYAYVYLCCIVLYSIGFPEFVLAVDFNYVTIIIANRKNTVNDVIYIRTSHVASESLAPTAGYVSHDM